MKPRVRERRRLGVGVLAAAGWAGVGLTGVVAGPARAAEPGGDGSPATVPASGPVVVAPSEPRRGVAGRLDEATSARLIDTLRALAGDRATRARALSGLRQLRDPELRPLFAQMAAQGEPEQRAEAMLTLAEMDPSKGLDLLLVRDLPPLQQARVLREGTEQGWISPAQLVDLVLWPDLEAGLYVSLMARLAESVTPGQPLPVSDLTRLRELAGSPDAGVAATSGLVMQRLGEAGAGAAALATLATPAGAMAGAGGASAAEAQRRVTLRRVIDFATDRRLPGGATLAGALLAQSGDDPLARFEAARALLVLGTGGESGAAWLAEWAAAGDVAGRQRLTLAALHASLDRADPLPPGVIAAMTADASPVINASGRVLAALSEAGTPEAVATERAVELVRTGHAPSVSWSLRLAEARGQGAVGAPTGGAGARAGDGAGAGPGGGAAGSSAGGGVDATAIRLAVIRVMGPQARAAASEPAIAAALAVARHDPMALKPLLSEAATARDEPLTQRVLSGAIRGGHPASLGLVGGAGADAGTAPGGWPGAVAGALAAILEARHAAELPQERLDALARVALGAGSSGINDATRAQAAWLALRHVKQDRAALASMMAPVAPSASSSPAPASSGRP